jgi:hypothetical protein
MKEIFKYKKILHNKNYYFCMCIEIYFKFSIVNVNDSFNLFLNIFLRIYYSSFPLIQIKYIQKNNSWITPGIMKSCKHKREICNELRNNNNRTFRSYYRNYSKILTAVIKKGKKDGI